MKKNLFFLTISITIIAMGFALGGCFNFKSSNDSKQATSRSDSQEKEVDVTIKPEQVNITGPLSEFFEVVDRNYKIQKSNYSGYEVILEVKRIAEGMPEGWQRGMKYSKYSSDAGYKMGFKVEFKDADGNILFKEESSDEDEMSTLAALNVDETATVSIDISIIVNKEKLNQTSKFKLGSEFEIVEPDEEEIDERHDAASTLSDDTQGSSDDYSANDESDYSNYNDYNDYNDYSGYDESDPYANEADEAKSKIKRTYRKTKAKMLKKVSKWSDKLDKALDKWDQ